MSDTENKFERSQMVGWYDPKQLVNTGIMTAISTIIGEYADPRTIATDSRPEIFFDYSKKLELTAEENYKPLEETIKNGQSVDRDEIWIDYVADVGDGWNSTYAVAYYLSQPELPNSKLAEAKEDNGEEKLEKLMRGEVLIFGGDGVYPTASPTEYERSLVTPYRMAFRAGEEKRKTADSGIKSRQPDSATVNLEKDPHIFALPGNHDWYDSLVAFKKIFCSKIFNNRRFAGAWRTRQKRSYFALKLPHDWWLLGVDLQLAHNIDLSQLEYFSRVVEEMDENSKVILCVPEPYWVKAIKYDEFNLEELEQKEKSIEKLEKFFLDRGIEIKVYIAGDLHHYRRFVDSRKVQKITAGGGGAFLHPTHDFKFKKCPENTDKSDAQESAMAAAEQSKESRKRERFCLATSYPDVPTSSRQDWKNLLFIWYNKKFGLFPAIIYTIIAWLIHAKVPRSEFGWWKAFKTTANGLMDNPLAILVIVLLVMGLIFFTDSNSKTYRRVAGLIHGLAHLTAVFFLSWSAYLLVLTITGDEIIPDRALANLHWFVWIFAVCFVGGWIIGSIIMGLYLFISLSVFGRHDNEAFSALKIEDYKNFLRLHITKKGLTIYPFKIETVPRDWEAVPDADNPAYFEPLDGSAPELIEKFITVK